MSKSPIGYSPREDLTENRVSTCNAPRIGTMQILAFLPNPHNNDPRTPTSHNVHVATHMLCGWNCDNITKVLDGTHKTTYTTTTHRVKNTKDTIQRTKEQQKRKSIRLRIRIQMWTKSSEDKRRHHIPAQAKPEGFPS